MRTIKFRGKRTDNSEWVYGYYVLAPIGNSRIYWKPFEDSRSNTYHFVDIETVGQFTGLLDKNGKEIYEGDIINAYDHPTNMESVKGVSVVFVACSFRDSYNGYVLQDSYINIEVIGNIHENPELLK